MESTLPAPEPSGRRRSNNKDGRLSDPALKRLRFLHFLNDRLMGLTIPRIAEKWNVHEDTVSRTLTWGKRAGLIADAEDRLLSEIFPAAEKTIIEAIKDGDAVTAREIYKMVVKGRDAKKGDGSASTDEDELARYMAERRKKQEQIENTVDGEFAAAALPPATETLSDASLHTVNRPEVAALLEAETWEDDSEDGANQSSDAGDSDEQD
jgi:hypothetical protein